MTDTKSHWHHANRSKRCILCDVVKPLGDFYAYGYVTKQGKQSTRYESRCVPCAQTRRRAQHHADPQKGANNSKQFRAERPGYTAQKAREYRSTERGRSIKAYHQRLRKARMRSQSSDTPAIRAVYAEAMRIEKIIAPCPVFALPELGYKMHVDHIVPLARGGKHAASNLQILPAGINLRKWAS